MLTRLTGMLQSVTLGVAVLEVGPVAYEVHVPACDGPRLTGRIGEQISLHTLHYLEVQGQGTSMLPRLIGFSSPRERAFFQLFTTVKGLGYRKALRALCVPFEEVALAIHRQDHDRLQALPEIGKRTAQTIIVELQEKMAPFLPAGLAAEADPAARNVSTVAAGDAVEVLVRLGETRQRAEALVSKAALQLGDDASANALVAAALS